MKVAIYARYSSENQSEKSIDDQVRVCQKYIESNNLQYDEKHVYVDDDYDFGGQEGSNSDDGMWVNVIEQITITLTEATLLQVDIKTRTGETKMFHRLEMMTMRL